VKPHCLMQHLFFLDIFLLQSHSIGLQSSLPFYQTEKQTTLVYALVIIYKIYIIIYTIYIIII